MSLISALNNHLKQHTTLFDYEKDGIIQKHIEHAWTMEPIEDPENNSPALFTLIKDGNASSELDMCNSQEIDEYVYLWYVVKHELLEQARNQVYNCILGWQYQPQYTGLSLVDFGVQYLDGVYIEWMEKYATSRKIKQRLEL